MYINVYTAMICFHKTLKFTHTKTETFGICLNFHLGVYGGFPV